MSADGRLEFAAPMGKLAKVITAVTFLLLVGVAVIGSRLVPGPEWARVAMIVLPTAILAGAALFMVRGYVLEGDVLLVRRLGWATRIPLGGLQTAVADPEGMKGAVRMAGNGGLFCFSGLFWSAALGKFRAYLTDHQNAVVLRWKERAVVVSPALPGKFVEEVKRRAATTA